MKGRPAYTVEDYRATIFTKLGIPTHEPIFTPEDRPIFLPKAASPSASCLAECRSTKRNSFPDRAEPGKEWLRKGHNFDRFLESPEAARFWALRMSDLLPINKDTDPKLLDIQGAVESLPELKLDATDSPLTEPSRRIPACPTAVPIWGKQSHLLSFRWQRWLAKPTSERSS